MSEPQRGEQEVREFGAAIIETLNQPKNSEKGDWRYQTVDEHYTNLCHEVDELAQAINDWIHARAGGCTCEEEAYYRKRIAEESRDVGARGMFIHDMVAEDA